MKRLFQMAIALAAFGIASCSDGTYPLSGELCAPGDPVQNLEAHDCKVLPVP